MSSEPLAQAASPRPKVDFARWPWRRLSIVPFALAGVALVATVMMERGTNPAPPSVVTTAPPAPLARPMAGQGSEPATAAAPHALGADQIQAMAQRLSERLARQPDDADGWAMLARTHALSGQHAQAVEAFRKAEKLRPADPVLLADFADALAMTRQRNLSGEPLQLVQRALKADPVNLKALSLAGTEAFNRKDYTAAVTFWEALQTAGGADSVFVQQVQGGIAEARQLAGMAPAVGAAPALGGGVKVKISSASGS
jgi:cytochrome c-type biogenesis protein CcmH